MTTVPPGPAPADVGDGVDADGGHGGDDAVVERSIGFSVEELAALARVSGRNLAPVVGPNPLAHVRLAERRTVLDIASRSLRARNVLVGPADEPVVADAVLGLLAIVSEAVLRADLVVSGSRSLRRRFHAIPYASVEHEVVDEVHRFTPFATVDVLARIARRAELSPRSAGNGSAMRLPYGAYAAARTAAAAGDRTAAAEALADAEVDDAAAGALITALAAGGATVGVRITHRVAPGTLAGGELAWLDLGDDGLWEVPTIDQPFASGGSGFGVTAPDDADALADGLDEAEVEVAPITADELAGRLFTFVPTDG